MQLSLSLLSLLPLLSLIRPSLAAADSKPAPKPCTIHSPSTGSYYDLRPLDLSLQQTSKTDSRTESWHAKGYDYPANFTLNFCGPVIESLEDVVGIPESRWKNVSACYQTEKNNTYSIGQSNAELVFRGRRLVLNYTGGSPCPDLYDDGDPKSVEILGAREVISGGDVDDDKSPKLPSKSPSKVSNRRKSTLLSLHCDRDPALSTHPSLSFLGTLDHCVYVFEAHSRYFCGGATSSSEPGSLGPGGVFGVIIVIALLAYLVGGCAYQRIVMRQRGWRQCPNYGVWSGLAGFIKVSCHYAFPCFRGRGRRRRGGGSSSCNSNMMGGGGSDSIKEVGLPGHWDD
jgi:cation-dependent mannose-6-phosphate receptor